MTVKQRLENYLKYEKISKTTFGNTIGVSASYINSIRKSIQPDKINSIAQNYPNLNITWLLTGEGEMLTQTGEDEQNKEFSNTFADDITTLNPNNPETMNMLHQMVSVIDRQSIQIDRLITQVEKSGDRADRMMSLIEHASGIESPKKEAM